MIATASRLEQISEYYFSAKLQEVRRLVAQGKDIINLGIGNPDLPPSPETIDVLGTAAREDGNHGYQPYRGIPELRSAMAAWYRRTYGVTLDPDRQVLPLMGSKEGIFHIAMAFLNPGDEALLPDPGYPGYAAAVRLAGGKVRRYDLTEEKHWLPDLPALAKSDLSRVKLMWLNYPHMPTGALAAAGDFQRLVDFARERNILLCHDNPYSQILNPAPPLSILRTEGAMDICLELNSLSKSHNMAGWRVGMLLGRPDYLDAVIKVKSNLDSGMFRPLQLAAVQALENSPEWHQAQNQRYRERREAVCRLLDLLGFTYPRQLSAGMFVWAKAPEDILEVDRFLDELLYEAGIFITPGKVFGRNGERYIRISVCQRRARIEQAAERIRGGRFSRSITQTALPGDNMKD